MAPDFDVGCPQKLPRKTYGRLRRPQGPNPGSEGARPTRSNCVIKKYDLGERGEEQASLRSPP